VADAIEKYLDRHGPALSSDVAAYLVTDVGMAAPAARKRVQRADNVRRLSGLTFPHRARFLYLQKDFGSDRYWSKLGEALMVTNSGYGFAVAALQQRDGIVPERHFPIVCGAPLRQSKHLAPETLFARLRDAGLLMRVNVPGVGDCIAFQQGDGRYEMRAERMRARLITEDVLLLAVKDWVRKLGVVSFGKVALRDEGTPPKVGTFRWDLSAPCYLGPLVRTNKDGERQNGFVACDVHLGEPLTAAGAAPFIRKCQTLRSLRKVGACLQIFVADRYEREAFQALKNNGIIPATPGNLFGEEVAAGLRQLTSVLESAAHSFIDPDAFDTLFRRLSKIEGAIYRLRGTLFEYLAAELCRKTAGDSVRMNRVFKVAGKGEAEADLVVVREHQSIRVIECKGYSPRATIPDDLFRRWLQHNVPTCFAAIKEHPDWKHLPVTFEFWSTAPVTDDAMALFNQAKGQIRPSRYSIEMRFGDELYELCRATRDPTLTRAFESHFLRDNEMPPNGFTDPFDELFE
jgi:hypothetical protein